MSRHAYIFVLAAGLLTGCGSSSPTPAAVTPAPPPTTQAPPPAPAGPAAFVCPLPALPDLRTECPKLKGGQLQDYVNIAVDRTITDHPEYFDLTDTVGGGSVKVKDRGKYIKAVVANIHAQGVCANEEIEEIQVKNTNEFHEQYNLWSSSGYTRRSYITTCFPAQF
jgi:hypothetical protein